MNVKLFMMFFLSCCVFISVAKATPDDSLENNELIAIDELLLTNDLFFDKQKLRLIAQGNDPFIVFKPFKNKNADNANKFLIFELKVDQLDAQLQLFFKARGSSFNPQYTLDFIAPKASIFALKIPDDVAIDQGKLRVDFNNCDGCQVSFVSARLSPDADDNFIVEANKIKNGTLKIDKQAGYIFTESSWVLNNIDGTSTAFVISGEDPYISSGLLNISTKELGGVYFKIKPPESVALAPYLDFQLFYATENNNYKPDVSSVARLPSSNKVIDLFIPLNYLNSAPTKDLILTRVRLDFPLLSGQWSVLESQLIHKSMTSEFTQYTPKLLLQRKRQKLRGSSLAKDILNNVLADKIFIFSYLSLMLLTAFIFFRRFKQ